MKTTEQIMKEYMNADSIKRDNMWYRFIALRGDFDDIERYGKAWMMDPSYSDSVTRKQNDRGLEC